METIALVGLLALTAKIGNAATIVAHGKQEVITQIGVVETIAGFGRPQTIALIGVQAITVVTGRLRRMKHMPSIYITTPVALIFLQLQQTLYK